MTSDTASSSVEKLAFGMQEFIERLEAFWTQLDRKKWKYDEVEVNLRDERYSDLKDEYQDWHKQIIMACYGLKDHKSFLKKNYVDFDKCLLYLEESRKAILTARSFLEENKIEAKSSTPPAGTQSQTQINPNFKLDRVKLPKFEGQFDKWKEFRDLFESAVDKNKALSGADKMVYLKTSLTGEAANMIQSFPTTSSSYEEAWTLVNSRYSNQREIVFAHLRKFDHLPRAHDDSQDIRRVTDTLNELIRSLKVHQVPVEHWDVVLVFMALKKLDLETKKQWLLEEDTSLPNLKEFIVFLETRARALADARPKRASEDKSGKSKSVHVASTASHVKIKCLSCGESHFLFQCEVFRKKKLSDRLWIIKKHELCLNCFSRKCPGTENAHLCKSKHSCKQCGQKHHTLIHYEYQSNPKNHPAMPVQTQQQSDHLASVIYRPKDPAPSAECSFGSVSACHVLLETAVVVVSNSSGKDENVRIFIDKGSEAEFITEACIKRLNLSSFGSPIKVTGLGGTDCGSTKGQVDITLKSVYNDFTLPIRAEVVNQVTSGNLPKCQGQSYFPHLHGLLLADPQFFKPSPVDVILGARYASLIKVGGLRHGPPGTPSAEETKFGWLLSGSIPGKFKHPHHAISVANTHVLSHHSSYKSPPFNEDSTLRQALIKFWEDEEPDVSLTPRSVEDSICENLFITTTTRDSDGRYIVHLLFRENHLPLQDSFNMALKRFQSAENRVLKNPAVLQEYRKYFRTHLSNGVLEPVPPSEILTDPNKCYYMPYTHVVKETSSTTKLRIVYDCSAKTRNGPSLNDVMLPGPKLQTDLVPLLIRFRSYPYALSADIARFYNQVGVVKPHCDFQRLVYRETPSHPIDHYRMTRCTFGVTAAPFLAIRSLHQLMLDEHADSRIQDVIKKETLVDNILTGSFHIPEALEIQEKLIKILSKRKFELRKWASNAPELLHPIPSDLREIQLPLTIQETPGLPTLGIRWNPASDTFTVVIPLPDSLVTPTKKTVLSQIARLYDPMGWLSPVTIRTKLLLQELWRCKLDWDTSLNSVLLRKWNKFLQDVPHLQKFTINRCYSIYSTKNRLVPTYQLIGFSDASNYAYSAVIYLRSAGRDEVIVSLVGSKTKVAPVKGETTPRLELNGARLLSRYLATVIKSLPISVESIHCYSDSMSVIGQLNPNSEQKQDVYVTNRVRSIYHNVPTAKWGHVNGHENPADCASRGISAKNFLNHTLWLRGPSWLLDPDFDTYTKCFTVSIPSNSKSHSPIIHLITRCSSFSKMKRVVAWCLRFITSIKLKTKISRPLQTEELTRSLHALVAAVQKDRFPAELYQLAKGNSDFPKNLKFLSPFIDKDGLLRVGGRISKSNLSMDQRHPMLLPKDHHFSYAVARYFHILYLHAGPFLLLCVIRNQFWIQGGPVLVKRVIRSCVICHQAKPRPLQQLMSDLPDARVTLSRPFTNTAMDFAGPFTLCITPGRNPRLTKSYFCVFVCMAVKAVHLELVSDLSTPAFLAALQRFVSRRGLPKSLYSDGGTNFVGARNTLRSVESLIDSSQFQTSMHNYSSEHGFTFHTNPPHSPHHGGLFEAAVKSTKYHLRRIIGDRHLSHEEFGTILCLVEAALNSRPLTPMSSDPSDFSVLTPAHFLVGSPLHSVPQQDLTELKKYKLSRWQLTQRIFQDFWKRFQTEYLQVLQSRPKWLRKLPNLEPGTLVLVKETDAAFSTHKWNLARVTQVFPGPDGRVRVAELKAPNGSLYRRTIAKIAPVPIE